MNKSKLSMLSPLKLTIVLSLTIPLLIAAAGGAFWLFRGQLIAYAEQVNKDAAQANVTSNDVRNLEKLKTQLEEDRVAITRTKSIVADSQSYQYQDQILNDLALYARSAGVTISGYSFNTAPTVAAAPAATPPTTTTPMPTTPAGIKSTSVTITLKSPLDYRALMRFVRLIEANLTKMQLTGLSLSQAPDSKQLVSTEPLTIEVYTR